MRQIPRYLIIGSGRLAQHISHYLYLNNLKFSNWFRSKHNFNQLKKFVESNDIIILAISDDAIENFINQNPIITNKILIHCSGCLSFENAIGIHPLMSFGNELYDYNTYKNISFIIDFKLDDFREMFPVFKNQVYVISRDKKAYYHALCVMSGNFTTILWSKLFKELESKFNIPKEAAFSYLSSIVNNLLLDHKNSLTGPIARGDEKTIKLNLAALKEDNFFSIYQAFVKVFGGNHGY